MTAPLNVLFVCTANICRSAYAEVRARALLADHQTTSAAPGVAVSSAGTWGWEAHPIDEHMGAVAVARGSDPAYFRSRRLTLADVSAADLILTAGREHRVFIMEDWPAVLAKTYTLGQFAESLDRIDADLRGRDAIAAVRALRHPARAATDVQDPYRQGPQAAAECGDHIDDLLTTILPRLG